MVYAATGRTDGDGRLCHPAAKGRAQGTGEEGSDESSGQTTAAHRYHIDEHTEVWLADGDAGLLSGTQGRHPEELSALPGAGIPSTYAVAAARVELRGTHTVHERG